MDKEATLERIVAMVGDLPAMPAVVAEVLEMTNDPNSQMADVSRVLQSDPALTAKILRVSNSSYYGMKQSVGSLKLALVILGVREIRNIVLGVSVFETLRQKGADVGIATEIWKHSLRVAGISKKLATHIGLGLQGEEFIAGLLHDIGKLVLLCQVGPEYAKIHEAHKHGAEALYDAELAEFGFTNADAAMALASRWNLPPSLSDALWYQQYAPGRVLRDAHDPLLAALTRIAKCAGTDDFDLEDDLKLASLQDAEAWEVLQGAKRPVQALDRRGMLAEFVAEVDKAPEVAL